MHGLTFRKKSLTFLIACLLAGCGQGTNTSDNSAAGETPPSPADEAINTTRDAKIPGDDWPIYGGNAMENHYSPLKQIDTSNIGQLSLAWAYDLPALPSSGVTAPLEVNGVLYFSVGHSVIHAMDATSGELLWQYDPKVYDVVGKGLRAAWGIRGIAFANDKIYAGTADGRLIAVDANTGSLVWSARTFNADGDRYLTGVPYIIGNNVIIGHGGADFRPVRGYVTAYDLETGEQAWRFYTVPGNPADGFESPAMEMAAKTWTGEWWRYGGGGTAWHAMAYDQEFNRVYIGTGNGAPWNQKIRSPGGGDNLFLCSIIALDADTGEYIWHYQVNPGETWDYNAAMDIELANLTIDGEERKVLLHAPKNGFFYVIDRVDGKLISAEPYSPQNWAEGIDIETGRPVEKPESRYPEGTAVVVTPDGFGAHGVEAMSFNPTTGLVYLPARTHSSIFTDPPDLDSWDYSGNYFLENGVGAPPPGVDVPKSEGWLTAWNPVSQQEAWRVPMENPHNGGTLTTAGNLVFQGRSTGEFSVYAADSGEKLWQFDTQNGIMAQPITYLVEGKQYVTLLTGWRGSTYSGEGPRWNYRTQKRRVLTFTLDGTAQLPASEIVEMPIFDNPDFAVDDEKAAAGSSLYHKSCTICHGGGLKSGGAAPDLLRSAIPLTLDGLLSVLHDGALLQRGMPPYPDLSREDVENLQHYIRKTARETIAKEATQEISGP